MDNSRHNVIFTCETSRVLKTKIIIDGNEVGKIDNGEQFSTTLPIGTHKVVFRNCGSSTKPFGFEVGENKVLIHLKMYLRTVVTSKVLQDEDMSNLFPDENIATVKVLGIRTGQETRVFATYNFSIYSLLITYKNGKKQVVECQADSNEFQKYLPYLDTDK